MTTTSKDAFHLLCRYRGAWQHVQNLEYDLEQARTRRTRSSARVLMDALDHARKMVQSIEDEVNSFIKTNQNGSN